MTEYLEAGFDTSEYEFSTLQGKFTATLDLKNDENQQPYAKPFHS